MKSVREVSPYFTLCLHVLDLGYYNNDLLPQNILKIRNMTWLGIWSINIWKSVQGSEL